ncbi:hypothetical protein COCC4DRAFT_56190 [Bipolaris maydis ATCC 48331]|uniref:Uncharacterized protein n=2 Tax=Cochliobolus heterostrophus TaxID=5016 RepID=M2TTK8_COCH5|nr:uncharacterized protein COCC4DRAFT_56190 [Bipolaris maydis ATCC 48331]EMD89834.1 hypothetical protein COCHEDRAFT_1156866 [Bipolaris maydis C5]ENI09953.1 hypothetical protein COCC4DRAFT_56190 [Bipolaris maydis ATCC 48331]
MGGAGEKKQRIVIWGPTVSWSVGSSPQSPTDSVGRARMVAQLVASMPHAQRRRMLAYYSFDDRLYTKRTIAGVGKSCRGYSRVCRLI